MSRTLHLEAAGRSEVGRCRSVNEDVFVLRADLGLYLVFDGMGGHAAGEVAAGIASETMQLFYEEGGTVWPLDAPGNVRDPCALLVAAAKLANARIRERAASEPEKRGMGAAAAALHVGASGFCLAHAGHCRGYRFRAGTLERLTEDHRALNAYLWRGVPLDIAEKRPDKDALTRALGLKAKIDISCRMDDARSGDIVLVCSNGLYDALPERQIAGVLAGRSDVGATADALIAGAQARGAVDDVTCVVLRWSAA